MGQGSSLRYAWIWKGNQVCKPDVDEPRLAIDHVEVKVQARAEAGPCRTSGQPKTHRGLHRGEDADQTLRDAVACRNLAGQVVLSMDHPILVDERSTCLLRKSFSPCDHLRTRLLHELPEVGSDVYRASSASAPCSTPS